MSRFDHGWGRDFAAGIGGQAEDIEQEVIRRLGPGTRLELISLAVEDVMEKRRPRW